MRTELEGLFWQRVEAGSNSFSHIRLVWVPGHSRIAGIGRTDELSIIRRELHRLHVEKQNDHGALLCSTMNC